MKNVVKIAVLVLGASGALAREPVWVFNNGPDAARILIGQGQLGSEVGLTKLIPTGTDLTLTLPMHAEDVFLADERPFFAVRYRYRTNITQGGLFFITDKLAELSDKSYSPFPVVGDNTWRTAIVDMRTFKHKNWSGKVTAVRFDPINPSDTDSVCEISRLGFFASEALAQSFIEAAVDAPDFSRPAQFSAKLQNVTVPGGCLKEGFDRADFMLQSTTVENPSVKTVVKFRPKGDAGAGRAVVISQTNSRGFTSFVARQPGLYSLENQEGELADIGGLTEIERLAVEFVVARKLLAADDSRTFRPHEPVSDADWRRVVVLLSEYGVDLSVESKPATRREAASALKKVVQTALGIAVESPYPKEYFTRDRIRLGAWVDMRLEAVDDDFMETYSAAGFDWILAHGALAGSLRRTVLLDCDRYGIELILGDGAYKNAAIATAEYFDHPSFAGTYIVDEPGSEQFEELAEICREYRKATGGKLPYINLLPMYANAAQLKFGANAAAIEYYDPDPGLYKKHCDAFCKMFDVPYICTDIYPLNWVKGKRSTYKNYCESINITATSAREHNKDFWCFIQTFAWTSGKRTPTESEFRWQSYCMLSFGCKTLLCWTYAGYNLEFPSLVGVDGRRSNAWYDAATVFKEIRGISDAFVRYKNIGAMSHNCTDATPYLRFSNPVAKFAAIERVECEQPLLIGCFDAKEGRGKAFTVVNMSELETVESAQVKMRLSGSNVRAWPHGRQVALTEGSDGMYKFTLAPGEGIFVEVD
ncbi:MAG: hypothetical protein PHU80_09040 [Kiritimatiellae bacterium]|nr:hypothetical protein [Kiritimatiellia bacterium]